MLVSVGFRCWGVQVSEAVGNANTFPTAPTASTLLGCVIEVFLLAPAVTRHAGEIWDIHSSAVVTDD